MGWPVEPAARRAIDLMLNIPGTSDEQRREYEREPPGSERAHLLQLLVRDFRS